MFVFCGIFVKCWIVVNVLIFVCLNLYVIIWVCFVNFFNVLGLLYVFNNC